RGDALWHFPHAGVLLRDPEYRRNEILVVHGNPTDRLVRNRRGSGRVYRFLVGAARSRAAAAGGCRRADTWRQSAAGGLRDSPTGFAAAQSEREKWTAAASQDLERLKE